MTLVLVERPSSQHSKLAGLIALFVLQVACFARYLMHFRYLPGTDAYYYALQAQSLLDYGHLKVPDLGVLHYVVAVICRSGASIETSFRIVLSGIYALYNLGLMFLIVRLKEKTQALAILLWVLGSSVVGFHAIEFPKLSLGLSMVPMWFLLPIGTKKGNILWLGLLLIACALLHPILPFLVVLFVSTVALGRARLADPWKRRFSIGTMIAAVVGCVLFVIATKTWWPGIGLRLASFRPGIPGMLSLTTLGDLPIDLKVTVAVIWLLLAILLVDYLLSGFSNWTYLIVGTLFIPLWPDREGGLVGLGGRLSVLVVFLASPLMIVICDELDAKSRLLTCLRTSRTTWCMALVAIGIACVLPLRLNGYNGLLMGDDYPSYERVVAALSHDDIPMLIAHRGLDFFYSYRLRRDAFHFDPEPNWKRSEIWRVAMRITPEEVAYYSPTSCLWGEAAKTIPETDYLLVREDCWEQLRARLTPADNPDLYVEVWEDSENPSQPRPSFLRRKHHNVIDKAFPTFSGDRN